MDSSLVHSSIESGYWGIMVVTYPYISGLVAGHLLLHL